MEGLSGGILGYMALMVVVVIVAIPLQILIELGDRREERKNKEIEELSQ